MNAEPDKPSTSTNYLFSEPSKPDTRHYSKRNACPSEPGLPKCELHPSYANHKTLRGVKGVQMPIRTFEFDLRFA